MISFMFELLHETGSINGYDLGHLTVQGENFLISSKQKNQNMMIFLSLTDLLYGVKTVLVDSKEEYNFVGTGCSFQFFIKASNDYITLISLDRKQTTNKIDKQYFINQVWNDANHFWQDCKPRADFSSSDKVSFDDLERNLKDFKECFKI